MDPSTQHGKTGDGDALRHAIGTLAVEFAELEFDLVHATGILIGAEETVGHVVLYRLSFKNLADLYCTLLGLRAPGRLTAKEMRALHSDLMAQEAYRNTIMHSFWFPDVAVEASGEVSQLVGTHLRIKPPSLTRKNTGGKVEFVEPDVVLTHAKRAKELGSRLIDLLPEMPRRVARARRRELSWLVEDVSSR